MPREKDLKRLVRARMEKTGEAYTAARAQLLRKAGAQAGAKAVAPADTSARSNGAAEPSAAGYAELAGTSDETIESRTGRTWARWVAVLDGHDAQRMTHRDIAALVHTKYEIDGWWSQAVTVGYERIKGLRARGQRRDGSYEASKSRTFGVPVEMLFGAWADARVRRRWLEGVPLKVRTATAPKSIRFDWPDGGILVVGFTRKGEDRSIASLAHTKLPDKQSVDRFKQYWTERLAALAELLDRR